MKLREYTTNIQQFLLFSVSRCAFHESTMMHACDADDILRGTVVNIDFWHGREETVE